MRRQAGMTQGELAQKLGVTKRTIINYEQGCSTPRDSQVLNALANEFQVTADYLLADPLAADYQERTVDVEIIARHHASELAKCLKEAGLTSDCRDELARQVMDAYWQKPEDK